MCFFNDTTNSSQAHTATYAYDAVNRLGSAVAKNLSLTTLWSQTYSYDRWGNMSCSGSGLCTSMTYSSSNNNQLASIGGTSVSYDAAGNLLVDPNTLPVSNYTWDAEGRLTKITQGASTYSMTTYNALGYGVETSYPVFGTYVNDAIFDPAGRELGYFHVGGNWFDRDIWAGNRMIAQLYPTETYFLHANNLHSDTQVTNHSGGATLDILYYPWGPSWNHVGSMVDSHFAEFQQSGSNLNNTPTRRYSNPQGRWLSPDPVAGDASNPQSLNLYAYVLNNPTSLVDPSGLDGCSFAPDNPACIGVTSTAEAPPTWLVPPNDVLSILCGIFRTCGYNTATDFGSGSIGGGGGGTTPSSAPPSQNEPQGNSVLPGLRLPNQTFDQCMARNSNAYSIGGSIELLANRMFNFNSSFSSNTYVSFFTGNAVTGLFFGSSATDAASVGVNYVPTGIAYFMGVPLTYGRRTTDIMSLNLEGIRGGPPLALSQASRGVQAGLNKLGDVFSLGMKFSTRLGIDFALAGAEAIGCAIAQ